jgi:hypothetical protein
MVARLLKSCQHDFRVKLSREQKAYRPPNLVESRRGETVLTTELLVSNLKQA